MDGEKNSLENAKHRENTCTLSDEKYLGCLLKRKKPNVMVGDFFPSKMHYYVVTYREGGQVGVKNYAFFKVPSCRMTKTSRTNDPSNCTTFFIECIGRFPFLK